MWKTEYENRLRSLDISMKTMNDNTTVYKNGKRLTKLYDGDAELIYYYLKMYKGLLESGLVDYTDIIE